MLTILLPTHRSELFPKSLESIFVVRKNSETISNLIINCDKKKSNNYCKYIKKYIPEIKKNFPNFKILYSSIDNNSINEIYYNLIKEAKTEYFYFLEDDDQLLTNFNFINKKYDYYIGLYKIHPLHEIFNESKIIQEIKKVNFFKQDPKEIPWYQLGQVVFKTKKIKWFPSIVDTHNDFYLLKNNPGKIKIMYNYFFKQGWSFDSFSQNFNKGKE